MPAQVKNNYKDHDRRIWESIFQKVPATWFEAPPSAGMFLCRDFLKTQRSQKILDLGCGMGRWAVFLAKNGVRGVTGLDYSREGVKTASLWAWREGLKLPLICADAAILPFKAEAFDAVVGALILDNLSRFDMDMALSEIERVTRPGAAGFFLFNPVLSAAQLEEIAKGDNPTKDCTVEIYSDAELEKKLAKWQILKSTLCEHGLRAIETIKR